MAVASRALQAAADREAHRRAGLCIWCKQARSARSKSLCDGCMELNRKRSKRIYERAKNGAAYLSE